MTSRQPPRTVDTAELLNRAWLIMSNANVSEWESLNGAEWVEAAGRWRDDYHRWLGQHRGLVADTAATVAVWLKARRDEHTPGNYPYWLVDCLLEELRDGMAEGHLPGTVLQRLQAEAEAS